MGQTASETGFSFFWRIENFSHLLERRDQSLDSPIFSVDNPDHSEWYLTLFPRGCCDEHRISCRLCLKATDAETGEISLGYQLSFLSVDGLPIKSKNFRTVFKHDMDLRDLFFTLREDVSKRKTEFLPDGNLTLRCCITDIAGKKVEPSLCVGHSRLDVRKTSFTWTIQNFGNLQSNQKKTAIVKPVCTQMQLYWTDDYVHIDISQTASQVRNLSICQMDLLDASGKVVKSKWDQHWFESTSTDDVWLFASFITRSELLREKNLLLPRENLSLRCDISVSFGVVSNKIENYEGAPNPSVGVPESGMFMPSSSDDLRCSESLHSLKNDVRHLYQSKKYSDVTIRNGRSTFPAHGIVLRARSPVFSDLLDKCMLENGTAVVGIEDLEEDIVDQLLCFLYTDTVADLTFENATKLYSASNKYSIPHLKQATVSFLKSHLSQSNVCEIMVLSDAHGDEELKQDAWNFIRLNEKEIFSSYEWKTLTKNAPQLAAEAETVNFAFLPKE